MAFDPKTAVLFESTTSSFDPSTASMDGESAVVQDEDTKQQVSRFDYIANQAKLGLIDTPVLAQALLNTFVIDPLKMGASYLTGKDVGVRGGIGERFSSNIQRLQQAAGSVVGAEQGQKAPDVLTGIIGSTARAVADPLGYVGAPVKAGAVTARAAGLGTAGATAEVGGMVGEQAEKAITGEDTGIGRAIGSITAVVKGAPLAAAAQEGVGAIGNVSKQVYGKYKAFKTDPDAANQAYASGAAKRLLEIIAKEQPGTKIDDIVTEFNRISNIINKQDLPLMVAMADNPAVRQQVARLAKTNPEFRNRVNLELDRLAQSIDARADVIFGQRYAPVTGVSPVTVKNAVKRREEIDNSIEKLASRIDTGGDPTVVGRAITNLVNARVTAARAEMAPVYKNILDEAAAANARLPAESVENIYNFIRSNNLRDIFGKGTAVDKAVMRVWGPKEVTTQPSRIIIPGQTPQQAVTKQKFDDAPFNEVESLKRRINELQRGRLTSDEARKLNQLEELVNNERRNIPGDFSQRLQQADLAYYEKVGVPFSAQGIKDIDAKKYAEQVAPVIVKNQSSLSQFLNAVGRESGEPIARNALLSEAYSKSVTDGILDPKKLQRFIAQKEGVLNQLPAVRNELQQASVDQGILLLQKKRIDDAVKVAEKRIADNFVTQAKDQYGSAIPDYQQITNRMFTDTRFFQKIQKDLKDLDPSSAKAVRNSLRAEIVQKARNNPDGGIAFLTDPKNAKVVDDMFGPGYSSAVKDLVKMSDAVNRADITRVGAVIERAELDALAKVVPGLDIPFVTSTLRDRIASVPQKIVRLATRVNTSQLASSTDDAIADLLLNPDGLKALQRTSKEINFKIDNPISVKKYTERLKSLLPQYFYVGVKEAGLQGSEPTAPEEEPFAGGYFDMQTAE
jgi:hypothetical protein